MPFDLATGKPKQSFEEEDYGDLTAEYLLEKMKEDKRIVGITAGTPAVFGFTEERRRQAGKQFVDVGIAEEHAVALASGIAANGGRPVFGVFSTFIQRAYDQLSQDLCINNNPAVILVFWGSLSSMNDVTHLCFFDIPVISNIPNMVYLAPTNKEEYLAMLEWSLKQTDHPVAIRVPANGVISSSAPIDADYSKLNRYQVTKRRNPRTRQFLSARRIRCGGTEKKCGNRRHAHQSPLYFRCGLRTSGGAEARSPGRDHAGRRHSGRRIRRKDCTILRSLRNEGPELWSPEKVRGPLRPCGTAESKSSDSCADHGGYPYHSELIRYHCVCRRENAAEYRHINLILCGRQGFLHEINDSYRSDTRRKTCMEDSPRFCQRAYGIAHTSTFRYCGGVLR